MGGVQRQKKPKPNTKNTVALAFFGFFWLFFGFFRFFFLYFGLGFVMIYTTPLKSIDSTVMGLKSELADTGCKYHFGTYFWVLES